MGVITAGGSIMKTRRAWSPIGSDKDNAEIEQLRKELTSFNERIGDLEKLHPESLKIGALKASAMVVSRQIDELRCANATEELTGLLAR
jgi:hypothetical protein